MRVSHGMRRLTAMSLATLIGMLVSPGALPAQELRGTVRDSASRQPISAAVVLLVDSTGVVLARGATDVSGAIRLPASPAARQLRVLRLGFRPLARSLTSIDSSATLDILLATVPVHLAPVVTTAHASCPA